MMRQGARKPLATPVGDRKVTPQMKAGSVEDFIKRRLNIEDYDRSNNHSTQGNRVLASKVDNSTPEQTRKMRDLYNLRYDMG